MPKVLIYVPTALASLGVAPSEYHSFAEERRQLQTTTKNFKKQKQKKLRSKFNSREEFYFFPICWSLDLGFPMFFGGPGGYKKGP